MTNEEFKQWLEKRKTTIEPEYEHQYNTIRYMDPYTSEAAKLYWHTAMLAGQLKLIEELQELFDDRQSNGK